MLLYVHRNRRLNYYGLEPRTATSTFTQLLSSDSVDDLNVYGCPQGNRLGKMSSSNLRVCACPDKLKF